MKKEIKSSIVLIGMPGAGKSTVGKLLAKKLKWTFVDLDELIKKRTGKTYVQILEQEGEEELLWIENQLVLLLDFSKPMVLAPGGSIVYSPDAMEILKEVTKVVYLELPLNKVKQRLVGRSPRGIVGLKEKGIEKLYKERVKLYKQYADVVIKVGSMNANQVVMKVLNE